MATVKDTEVARLAGQLAVVEASIKRVLQNGQSFRKGNFYSEQVKLAELRKERSELRNKLALWGVYEP